MSRSTVTVKIESPVADLPSNNERATTPPAQHWLDVAAAARQHEGQWIPVTITGKTKTYYQQAASSIRSAATTSGGLYAFRTGGYDAAYRDGKLYVRYAPAPILTTVPRTEKASA